MIYKDPWHFYHTMNYPIPQPQERFANQQVDHSDTTPTKKSKKSRKNITTTNISRIQHINKHKKLYNMIPFVTHIYVCNSLSFNATKINSDIDFTIITQEKRIRTARLYSVLLFRLRGIKRTKNKTEERFCLSFYLSHDHVNLYSIKRPHSDHYLAYWIAHLIPVYTEPEYDSDHILKENNRIRAHLPHLPSYLPIVLDKQWPFSYQTKTKKIIEKLHYGRRGNIIESCIKYLRLPIIRYKKRKLRKPQDIITSDTMLKFHYDKRDSIHDILKISR